MHARLELDGRVHIYAGGCPPTLPNRGIHSVSIALNYDNIAQAERVSNALAEGGAVTMPFGDTFWAGKFGMLIDKFRRPWIINGALMDVSLQG